MSTYRLTKRADADLFHIFLYGIESFGLGQAKRYAESMSRCFQLLADNPGIGRRTEAVGKNIRRHEHGSHVVLYEDESDGVLILAIVHARSMQALQDVLEGK
jgi:toxin ParE1/3/4